MRQYVIRRILLFIPVLLGASILIFVVLRIMPGDVAAIILSGGGEVGVSAEAVAELRHQLGTDRPLPEQYLSWLGGLLRLDAGSSYHTGVPVFEEIRHRFPRTLELALLVTIISVSIALPIGVLSAIYQDTWLDYIFRVVSIAGLAMPSFWTATLLILIMAIYFRWMPPLGFVGLLDDPWSNLQQLVWPALILGYYMSAPVSRMTRSCMLEVLRQDYIRTARSKGLRERWVILTHALRNAIIPVITLIGMEFAYLLGGTVIMETIFAIPGMGFYLVEAVRKLDFIVVQDVLMVFAVIVVVGNLIVDLVYGLLDPRIRYQ